MRDSVKVVCILILVFSLNVFSCGFSGQLSGSALQQGNTIYHPVTAIAAGSGFSFAVSRGYVFSWGKNDHGQLGLAGNKAPYPVGEDVEFPTRIENLSGILRVSVGENFALALAEDGTVWSWGANDVGQLGLGGNTVPVPDGDNVLEPMKIEALSNIVHVEAGSNFSLAVGEGGIVWSWGDNTYGQLGLAGNTNPVAAGNNRNEPVQIINFDTVQSISAGGGHILAMKEDLSIWSWGRNDHGQLGLGQNTVQVALGANQDKPQQIEGYTNVLDVFAGETHSAVTATDQGKNVVYTFGDNQKKQLGRDESLPNADSGGLVNDVENFTYFMMGYNFTLALVKDGDSSTPYFWGHLDQYITKPTALKQNSMLTFLQDCSIGRNHLLFLDIQGIVWGRGKNDNHQLGVSDKLAEKARSASNLSPISFPKD